MTGTMTGGRVRVRRFVWGLLAVVVAVLPAVFGTTPATGDVLTFQDTVVAGGLSQPTAVAALPDGRFLVTSQDGRLWLIQNGTPTLALNLGPVACASSEMGLLGVTVDPSFASNHFIYVYYTAAVGGSCDLSSPLDKSSGAMNRVSRFTLNGSTAASEAVLLDDMPEWGGNHNGGYVRYANDGTLYVTVGDGGGNRPFSNPADLSVPNGKILRISPTPGGPIPPGNPHGSVACRNTWGVAGTICGEIWADGLRNPFRLGWDVANPNVNFRINDVGEGTWEEVDNAVVNSHYGWPCQEGPGPVTSTACNMPIAPPVLWYQHNGTCTFETGGAFVPPGTWPGYDGAYIWIDDGCGQMFVAQPNQTGNAPARLMTLPSGVTDLEFFPVGGKYQLFYTTYAGGGQLHMIAGQLTELGVWEGLGGAQLGSAPSTVSWAPGRIDAVATDAGGHLLWRSFANGGWSAWTQVDGATLGSGPAIASWTPGRLDVFARGTDGGLWHKWFSGGAWSGWEPLGGQMVGEPTAVSWASGRIDVMVRGTDNQVWHKFFNGTWSGWEPLGGLLTTSPGVAAWAPGRLDVFAAGADHQLWHKWFSGTWSGWEPLGGLLSTSPSATAWAPGRLDVVVAGSDNQVWHKCYCGGWSGWEGLRGGTTVAPSISSWGPGRLDIFARGGDNTLFHKWYDNGWN